jgi:hypothetical protein
MLRLPDYPWAHHVMLARLPNSGFAVAEAQHLSYHSPPRQAAEQSHSFLPERFRLKSRRQQYPSGLQQRYQ